MAALHKFRALPRRRRKVVMGALLGVAASRLALSLLPFRLVKSAVERLGEPRRASRGAVSPDELAWAVTAVSRYVPRATCLTQALALQVLLGRYGHEAELRIGVAKEDGRLAAHAWVISDGRILVGGPEVEGYAPLSAGSGGR